jgi:hypothetical protein
LNILRALKQLLLLFTNISCLWGLLHSVNEDGLHIHDVGLHCATSLADEFVVLICLVCVLRQPSVCVPGLDILEPLYHLWMTNCNTEFPS